MLINLHDALGDHRISNFDKAGDVGAHHQVSGWPYSAAVLEAAA